MLIFPLSFSSLDEQTRVRHEAHSILPHSLFLQFLLVFLPLSLINFSLSRFLVFFVELSCFDIASFAFWVFMFPHILFLHSNWEFKWISLSSSSLSVSSSMISSPTLQPMTDSISLAHPSTYNFLFHGSVNGLSHNHVGKRTNNNNSKKQQQKSELLITIRNLTN